MLGAYFSILKRLPSLDYLKVAPIYLLLNDKGEIAWTDIDMIET